MYGVGAAGARGAGLVIDILRAEMLNVAAHLGVTSMAQLTPAFVRYPPGSPASRLYDMRRAEQVEISERDRHAAVDH
jgi:hypothetical protein